MKNAETKKIIQLRFRRLNRYYKQIKEDASGEAIHHFRVEIKKLRAFLRLLSDQTGTGIKIPHVLKKIYRKAGKVRDLQLHQLYLENTGSLPKTYQKRLSGQLALAQKKLNKSLEPGLTERAKKELLSKTPGEISQETVIKFIGKKLSAIQHISSAKSITDQQLHEIRKYLKDIVYIAAIFEKELSMPLPFPGWNQQKKDYYTELTNQLGHHQDQCSHLARLDASHPKTESEKKWHTAMRNDQKLAKLQLQQGIRKSLTDTNHLLS